MGRAEGSADGLPEGREVGNELVGIPVGDKQAGYSSGSSAGEFIGSSDSTPGSRAHREEGINPPSSFSCSESTLRFDNAPKSLGIVPFKEFRSIVSVESLVKLPIVAGIVPSIRLF